MYSVLFYNSLITFSYLFFRKMWKQDEKLGENMIALYVMTNGIHVTMTETETDTSIGTELKDTTDDETEIVTEISTDETDTGLEVDLRIAMLGK